MKEQSFFDPSNEVLHYENHLGLTGQQKPQVLRILEEKLELYKGAAARRERITKETRELSEKIQALNKQLEAVQHEQAEGEKTLAGKLRALLDDGQRKKFDAMEKERLRKQREFEAAHGGRGTRGAAQGDQPGKPGA